jgi:hypothetical protein
MKIEIPIALTNDKLANITGKDEIIYTRCTLDTDQIEAIYENTDYPTTICTNTGGSYTTSVPYDELLALWK